jgi:hypothetical protein
MVVRRSMKHLAMWVGAALAGSVSLSASAAEFRVDRLGDLHDLTPGDGFCRAVLIIGEPKCTLRAAIEEANALPGDDVIVVAEATYVLTLGQLLITQSVDILGEGMPVIDANHSSRVFDVTELRTEVQVLFRSLTIRNGEMTVAGHGGAGLVVRSGAHVELNRCRVEHNEAIGGGAGIWATCASSGRRSATTRTPTMVSAVAPTPAAVASSMASGPSCSSKRAPS